jgi:hypothetical protein
LLGHQLNIFPPPAQRSQTPDVYGNQRTFFSLQAPHTTLRVVAVSEVRTRRPVAADSRLAWEAVRERFRFHAGAAWDAAAEFVFASHHVLCGFHGRRVVVAGLVGDAKLHQAPRLWPVSPVWVK